MWALGALCASASSARAEVPCREVQRTLANGISELDDVDAVLRLAPFIDEATLRTLEGVADRGPDAAAYAAVLAVGFSRRADALGVLRARPGSKTAEIGLGKSLALLALGDGSQTGTIAKALSSDDVERRRRTERALARMHQRRPALLLETAMVDPDEEVRSLAAERSIETKEWRGRGVHVG